MDMRIYGGSIAGQVAIALAQTFLTASIVSFLLEALSLPCLLARALRVVTRQVRRVMPLAIVAHIGALIFFAAHELSVLSEARRLPDIVAAVLLLIPTLQLPEPFDIAPVILVALPATFGLALATVIRIVVPPPPGFTLGLSTSGIDGRT